MVPVNSAVEQEKWVNPAICHRNGFEVTEKMAYRRKIKRKSMERGNF